MTRTTIVSREISITENNKHLRYFTFPLPISTEPGYYRTILAFSAFFENSNKRRNWKPSWAKPELLYTRCDLREFETYESICKTTLGYDIHAEIPRLQLNSVWEFFEAIGWNPKTKKWSKSTVE